MEKSPKIKADEVDYVTYVSPKRRIKGTRSVRKVKFIVSNKSDLATERVNKFIEELRSKWLDGVKVDPTKRYWYAVENDVIEDIKPIMSYSGTNMMVGCMIDYWDLEEVKEEKECPPKSEQLTFSLEQ